MGAALRAACMVANAVVQLKEELEQSYRPGVTTAQRTELRSRIANLETELATRRAAVDGFMTNNPAVRAKGHKLIEARKLQVNVERASRGLAPLDYETKAL